jgi:hypothetical protein
MGYDASCTLKFAGQTARGTAWLEHKDLVFRGPMRLAIPLKHITSAAASNGTLQVYFDAQRADFTLGAVAEKWAERIMHPPSRLDKLGVKQGMTVAAIAVSDRGFLEEAGTRAVKIIRSIPGRARPVDLVFYEAAHREALERMGALAKLIKPEGAVWVVRPKGSRDITEAETMAAGKRAGLVDVKVVSFSETHTAEKFVIPVAKRPRTRKKAHPHG